VSDYTAEEFAEWTATVRKYGTQEMAGVEMLRVVKRYRERMAEIGRLYTAYQQGHPHDGVPDNELLEIAESVILGMQIQATGE
jgi:hypothetical protein